MTLYCDHSLGVVRILIKPVWMSDRHKQPCWEKGTFSACVLWHLFNQPTQEKNFMACPVAFICSLNDPLPSKLSCQWLISDHKYQLLLIVERVLLYVKESKWLVVATSAPYGQNLEPSEKDRTQQLVLVTVKSSLLATISPPILFCDCNKTHGIGEFINYTSISSASGGHAGKVNVPEDSVSVMIVCFQAALCFILIWKMGKRDRAFPCSTVKCRELVS